MYIVHVVCMFILFSRLWHYVCSLDCSFPWWTIHSHTIVSISMDLYSIELSFPIKEKHYNNVKT